MGRRLNLPTPTVINTELIPLEESFYIESDGQLEQWYYENDGRYAPNRKVTPMTLKPRLSAFDKDTNQSYEPSFYIVRWYELAYNETQGDYVETEITNSVDSLSADYVKTGNTLLVKKNVGYTHSITLTCRAQYIDPRDSGITYSVEDKVLLTTNRDATVMSPELDVDCPTSQAFNPLTDNETVNGQLRYKSQFTMKASSDFSSVLASNIAQYKVDPLGTEEIIPNNDSAVVTSAPTMDIRYGDIEQTNQKFMYRQTSGGQATSIIGNMAYIGRLVGNTVKWNQLAINNIANGYYTFTNGSNIVVSGTPSTFNSQEFLLIQKRIVGHKYYAKITSDITNGYFRLFNYYANSSPINTISSDSGAKIFTETNDYYATLGYSGVSNGTYKLEIRVIDLTTMFGAGNEPTTVEQFEQWLAQNIGLKSYYPYNEGELIPVKMSAIKSVGFNIWDEEWEIGGINLSTGQNDNSVNQIRSKNFIPVTPNTNYYLKYPGYPTWFVLYDSNKNLITYTYGAHTLTTPANAKYIRFKHGFSTDPVTTYNHDICINLSDASRNGTYEAHWEALQDVPITQIKGRANGTGDLVTIFPNGMQKVNDVYDEIFVEDGVIKAVKRFERVNLGDLTWTKYVNYHAFNSRAISDALNKGIGAMSNMICSIYTQVSASGIGNLSTDKTFCFDINSTQLDIRDTSFDSATETEFKTAMNGVYLVYELATPVTYIIENMPRGQFEWYGVDGGSEVLVENMPWYVSGQHTDTLVVDAMYGEEIRVVLRSRISAGASTLYPTKVYRSIVWKVPDVDTNAYSENGGAVRSNTVSMGFATIVNIKGATLSDDVKDDNLRFNWKVRKSNSSDESDFGWGEKKTIAASDLRNSIGSSSSLDSTLVLPYVYLLGANEVVTESGIEVTDDGQPVYDRPVF